MKVSIVFSPAPVILLSWLAPSVLAHPVSTHHLEVRGTQLGKEDLLVRTGAFEDVAERGLLDHVPGFKTKLLTAEEKEQQRQQTLAKEKDRFQKEHDKFRLKMAHIESGGAKHHKLTSKYLAGAPGEHDKMLRAHAHKEAHKYWKSDIDAKMYKHAEVSSRLIGENKDRIQTTVRYHHEGQKYGHTVHMLSDVPKPKKPFWSRT